MPRHIPGDWHPGTIPDNVRIHETAFVETSAIFAPFRSELPLAVDIAEGAAIYTGSSLDLGPRARLTVGRCSILSGCLITADELVSVGDYAMIGWLVSIADTATLPRDPGQRRGVLEATARDPRRRIPRSGPTAPVRIGSNTWIGFECCIAPGVTIGDGSIVGARSVVLHSIPPYSIAAGNPASIVRRIPPQEHPHA